MSTPVEDIKQRLDIVELINEYIPLKAAGSSWKAKCPFHNEKTPSFMVSRDRGTWHCFGCGRGGDMFSFVEEIEGMDFPETLRLLAKRAGVQLKDFDPKAQSQKTRLLDLLRWVNRYYQEVLRKATDAKVARDYLQERGVKPETVEEFGLGFAPNGWDTTYQALRKKGFKDDDIFQAGLTIKKDRGAGYYDRFRGRIMFPISDVHGTVVGFSGRILDALVDPKGPPPGKYINSPQTIAYNKSAVVYALDKAKQAIKQADRAVLVEGQMDCLSSHQAGVMNVVASSGTALTADQVGLLKRFSSNIVLSFDRDAAGFQAALRGVDQALQVQMNVYVTRLPAGKDPDELIRQDVSAWSSAIAKAQPYLEYMFEEATLNRDLTKVEDKKAVAKFLLPILGKVADPVEQSHYLQRLADLVQVEAGVLRKSLPSERRSKPTKTKQTSAAESIMVDRFRAISERFLAVLIAQPGLIALVEQQFKPEYLVADDLQRLYKTLIIWYSQHHFSTAAEIGRLAGALDPDQQERLTVLTLLGDKELSGQAVAALEQDLLTMAAELQRHALTDELQRIEADLRQLEGRRVTGPELSAVLERFEAVTDQLRQLS